MNTSAFLARIAYNGPTAPSVDVLRDLQMQYLLTVPFENLDIHLGRPIRMDVDHLFHKIVTQRRGGFCYESNTLFAALLRELGFDVTVLSARMVFGGQVLPDFVHMTLLVKLDKPYIVDVGNGQSVREPLATDGSSVSTAEGRDYTIGIHDNSPALMFRDNGLAWQPRFLFTSTPRDIAEFEPMCAFTQSSPDSFFVQHRLATIATPEGRRTLMDQRFAIEHGNKRDEVEIKSESQFHEHLREHYAIELHNAPLNWQPRADAITSM